MFSENLKTGKIAESEIANWLTGRGFSVLPVYEKDQGDYKGPTLRTANSDIIAPDMLVFLKKKIIWIEAKHKSAFSWHRISRQWVTGIDLYHYKNYLKIAESIDIPIWLLFLHRNGIAKDTHEGMVSPTGLYGNELILLAHNENHRHNNHGKHGMVYWGINSLKRIADISEFKS